MSAGEIRPKEQSASEVRFVESGAGEVRPKEQSASEVRPAEPGASEVRFVESGAGEVSPDELGADEIRSSKLGTSEVKIDEVDEFVCINVAAKGRASEQGESPLHIGVKLSGKRRFDFHSGSGAMACRAACFGDTLTSDGLRLGSTRGAVTDEVVEDPGSVGGMPRGILNDLFHGQDSADAYVPLAGTESFESFDEPVCLLSSTVQAVVEGRVDQE
nr:hypothetical protein [Streptomyces olivoreticuli]